MMLYSRGNNRLLLFLISSLEIFTRESVCNVFSDCIFENRVLFSEKVQISTFLKILLTKSKLFDGIILSKRDVGLRKIVKFRPSIFSVVKLEVSLGVSPKVTLETVSKMKNFFVKIVKPT